MTPRRPYLLRAFYDWLVDNELTPHLVVDANLPGVRVPLEFVQNGQIILNLAPRAVGNLELGNEAVTFQARFSGQPHSVIVPLYAIQAIYARENGAGTMFEPEEVYDAEIGASVSDSNENIVEESAEESMSVLSAVEEVESTTTEASFNDDPDDEPPVPPKRPTLRVVK
ncbi:ClpXP protease specificity-enhancing factor [Vibrio sp.]|nr:ClpXP protease specificity-enhancing factor [Vibrio sp.]